MKLENKREVSTNANPENLIENLKFSKDLSSTADACYTKRKCPKCGTGCKYVCYNCSIGVTEDDVLPKIDLPFDLIV